MNTATITTPEKTVLLSKKGMKEMKKSIATLERDRSALIKGLHDLDRTSSHDDRLERIERLAHRIYDVLRRGLHRHNVSRVL